MRSVVMTGCSLPEAGCCMAVASMFTSMEGCDRHGGRARLRGIETTNMNRPRSIASCTRWRRCTPELEPRR